MRPPAKRNQYGVSQQIRPNFGAEMKVNPPKKFPKFVENSDSMFAKACVFGHEKQMRPLEEVNRFRLQGLPFGGDSHKGNFQPMLQVRPNCNTPMIVKMYS